MNSGVPDAVTAARAIDKALRSNDAMTAQQAVMIAADKRKKAAQYNRDAAGVALHHLQGKTLEMKLKRSLAASFAPMWPRLGKWLDEGPYGPKNAAKAVGSKY